MRKIRLFVVAALLALPITGMAAAPAHACTSPYEPNLCDTINRICHCLG